MGVQVHVELEAKSEPYHPPPPAPHCNAPLIACLLKAQARVWTAELGRLRGWIRAHTRP